MRIERLIRTSEHKRAHALMPSIATAPARQQRVPSVASRDASTAPTPESIPTATGACGGLGLSGEAVERGLHGLPHRRIRRPVGELVQIAPRGCASCSAPTAYDAARAQPRVFARQQRRDRLLGGLERRADELVGDARSAPRW